METTLEDIAKKINRLIISDIKNTEIIDNYFAENTKEFSKLMDFINRC
jgi:hypothetical protein